MTAIISPCGTYRYTLERAWSSKPRYLLFIMLNPSTADAEKDDPTIRRCRGFAEDLGFTGLLVANLYALRATEPKDLKIQLKFGVDVVGPDNNKHIKKLVKRASLTLAAWGQRGPIFDRAAEVRELVPDARALAFTKKGEPRHPLMLPKDLVPITWS